MSLLNAFADPIVTSSDPACHEISSGAGLGHVRLNLFHREPIPATIHSTRHLFLYSLLSLMILSGCNPVDGPEEVAVFCDTLDEINAGSVDTRELSELEGHARVLENLLAVAPHGIRRDLNHIHRTIDDWASAVSGNRPMIDTFKQLSDPKLVGSEGRLADYIAENCGIDLGGMQWVIDDSPESAPICPGWPRVGTPLNFNFFPNLPDIAGSNYFSNTFVVSRWAKRLGLESFQGALIVEPGGRVEFRGQYPQARYFGFHPNDMDLNNLDTLRDVELAPDRGFKNPFVDISAPASGQYFTATLEFSPTPDRPQANTSYVGERKLGGTNKFVMNLLRMYHVNSGNGPGSGSVPLPAVTVFDAEGNISTEFPECDLFEAGPGVAESKRRFPVLPLLDHRAKRVPGWSTSSNFEAPSDTLANADVQYLSTHYSSRFGDLLVVRGRYLSAPDTRGGESPALERQVRLYNICTYNFWNGSANQCLLENQLNRDDLDFYTLVISSESNRPGNLKQAAATWIDWGNYLDGQISFRYLYRENPFVKAIAAGARGEPVSAELEAYVPRAAHCDKQVFERGGWQACFAD